MGAVTGCSACAPAGEPAGGEATALAAVEEVASAPPPTISGRLSLEVPTGLSVQTGDTGDPGTVEDATDRPPDAADPWASPPDDPRAFPDVTLAAPPPEACRVRAWRGGTLLGEVQRCDAEGRWTLTLDAARLAEGDGPIAVESWVAERLRGVVEVVPTLGQDTPLETLALGFGTELRGTVVDARGELVPHVLVEAMPVPDLAEPIPWRAESDEAGRFVIEAFPPGPAVLRIVHRDFAVSVLEAVAPERDVVFRLEALYDIEGKVVLGKRAWTRVIARLEGSSVWPPLEVPVAEDGTFVFTDVVDGVYGVEVLAVGPGSGEGVDSEPGDRTAPRGGEVSYASIPLENVTPDMAIDVALIPAHAIPVQVVDTAGRPVAGARVRAGYADVALLQRQAESDALGRAVLGPLVPGPYRLNADADGFLPAVPVSVDVGAGTDADSATPTGVVELVLAKPARLAGVVRDEDGRPVRHAEVVLEAEEAFMVGESAARASTFALLQSSERRPGVGSLGVTKGPVPEIPALGEADDAAAAEAGGFLVLTDEQGRFDIPELPPGKYRVIARHGDHAASVPKPIELDSGAAMQGLELVVRRGQPLTGRVRDGNGRPVEFASVELDDGTLVVVDDRGVFDVGFRRGRVKVIVRAPGYAPKLIQLDVGAKPVDLEVALDEADGRAGGVVRDGNGQAITAALVELVPRDGIGAALVAKTDDTGAFTVEGVADGRALVVIDHPDYLPQSFDVRIREGRLDDLQVVLRRGWAIEVAIRERGSGRAVPGALVRMHEREVFADRDGKARLTRLGARAVDLDVSAASFVRTRVQVPAPSGALDATGREVVEATLVVELDQGGAIEGTMQDDIGDPVVGAELELWLGPLDAPTEDEPFASTKSGSRGAWRFDDVPEGEVVILARPPRRLDAQLEPLRHATDVERGEVTRDVALRFDRP
jgi:protocatechuate 3,4-dioxygenase beta subunit